MLREFPGKSGTYAVSTSCCRNDGLLGQSTVVPAVADDAAPAQLIALILFTNWSYTKMPRRVIIFARCT